MNIVEKEAIEFYKYGFLNGNSELGVYKSLLTSKLYNFNRDRDKLDFLKTVRTFCSKDIENHMKNCSSGCGYEKPREIAIFAIDQEIDYVNGYYYFEPNNEDLFSSKEESELHNKLNEIIEKLEKQSFGQQIIFDEIENLKNHFNLGKKTWFQLLKVKLIDLTIETVLEKTVVKEIYDNLIEGFEQVPKMLQ